MRAEDYALEEVKQDESFYVKNFRETQLSYVSRANATFLTSLIYRDLADAIRIHDMDRLKTIVDIKLNLCGISLRDLPFRQTPGREIFIGGEKYIPPLELAAATRNFLAFSFLVEAMFSAINVNNYVILRPIERNLVQRQTSARVSEFSQYLNELREWAEEGEIYELVDILDNFEEDKEIAAITDDGTNTDFNRVYWESLNMGKLMKFTNGTSGNNGGGLSIMNESMGPPTGARTNVNISLNTTMSVSNELKSSSHRKNSTDMDIYNSNKLNSKLCTIL